MTILKHIQGLLIDLDGVLYVGETPVAGAQEVLNQLKEHNIPRRYLTNTTTRTASSVVEKLCRLGFSVEDDEVFTPITATVQYLHSLGNPSVNPVVRDSVLPAFTEFSKDNGSTAIVENSHKKNKFPNRNDIKKSKIKIIKMKPRSILIYNGLLWHGASPNFSTYKKRYAIVAQYMPNYIVPMEDLKKMTKKHLIKKNSTLKKLLGYDLEFPSIYKSK